MKPTPKQQIMSAHLSRCQKKAGRKVDTHKKDEKMVKEWMKKNEVKR